MWIRRDAEIQMNTLINCLKGPAGFLGKLFVNDNDEYSSSSISHCHILIMTYVVDDIYC